MQKSNYVSWDIIIFSPKRRGVFNHYCSNSTACKPSAECLAYGGYCIRNSQKGNCHGLLFAKECNSALCSCCIEATLKKDECQEIPGVCPNGTSVCQDKDAGYECVCNAGFETTMCADIDECLSDPCADPNSHCVNTIGSYVCECEAGYILLNGMCGDINECVSDPCQTEMLFSHCENTLGSYECICDDPDYYPSISNGYCAPV
ncbi:latent-transforming growth factor beta-binding protein 2-like [Macrobrachium nipponense]|uniref:latent-transforming growth factor beta-binding protein 2-like n=1 Tax=Macrobrachium nipponense TaxID=159736 RepID=UPI0030C8BFC5